jgi:hypothetical protein
MATETLISEVIFDIATYYIVMVNDITWPDQILVEKLLGRLKDQQTAKSFQGNKRRSQKKN